MSSPQQQGPSSGGYTPIDDDGGDNLISVSNPKIQGKKDPKIEKLQEHVNEVSNIMQMNIDKIMERGSNLDNLQDRSEYLANNSVEFRAGARRIQRKMWWKNMKLNLILAAIIVVILIIIIVSFTTKSSSSK